MKKRTLARTVWAGTMAAVLAAGCSSQAEKPEASGGDTPAKKENITVSIYDRNSVPAEEGTIEKNRWTQWLNDNGPANVKFASIPRNDATAKFNTLFASGSAPNLIFEYSTSYRDQLYSQKQLMPVDELIANHSTEYKALLEENPILQKVSLKSDGKMYEFGRINGRETNHTLFIRNDWLKKLNLEVPKTVDEFFEVAKAFAEQDPDGNGVDDTFGFSLSYVSGQISNAMFQNSGIIIEGDKIVYAWDQLEEATRFKKRMYDAGLIDKDYLADSNGEKALQDFINGKLGIYGANGGAGSAGFAIFDSLKKNNPDAEIIPIPLPEGPFGQFSPVINNPVQMTAAINSSTKNPEAVMAYIDFLVSPANQETLLYGIEGEHWTRGGDSCPQPMDTEKNKKELDWNVDFRMLNSPGLLGKCATMASKLNPDNPIDKEFLTIIELAKEAYLDPARPISMITHGEHMPNPPQELNVIWGNTNKFTNDVTSKAVVSGSTYSVEKAMEEAKANFEKAGAPKVMEWYNEWYAENKDNAFLKEDIYKIEINQ